jgi:glycerol-3-phosphate dehydrogenase
MTMTQSSQNQASKALAEMYNSNTDYIQRLKEIISLNQLVQMQAEDMAGIELIGKPKNLVSLCATNHHALQQIIKTVDFLLEITCCLAHYPLKSPLSYNTQWRSS